MARLSPEQRQAIAEKRLLVLLGKHGVATMRTIEQKISDAGPFNQRVNPHVLTVVRNELQERGLIGYVDAYGARWYFLREVDASFRAKRLEALGPIAAAAGHPSFTERVGNALEIAVYRSLVAADADFQGRFCDLDDHADDTPYSKEEPPSHIGSRSLPGHAKLDFHYRHDTAGWAAVECKNIREWLYPNRKELRELITKAFALNCVPVLIARRIHPATYFVFGKCGLIIHQNYNQLTPMHDTDLVANLKHKDRMGFFDIRQSNQPDHRLLNFIGKNLPLVLPEARAKWDAHADLIQRYASDDEMTYQEFAGRIGRRSRGENEDGLSDEPEMDPDDF